MNFIEKEKNVKSVKISRRALNRIISVTANNVTSKIELLNCTHTKNYNHIKQQLYFKQKRTDKT